VWLLSCFPHLLCKGIVAAVKSNFTKRRYKAQKSSACAMCKPYKRGWEDKKNVRDLRVAIQHEQELKDTLFRVPV
jgi:hypothetical protein